MLREKIKIDLKTAMKAGDKTRVSTIRLLLAAIKDKDIATKSNLDSDNGINDSGVLELVNKMLKQRTETAETYRNAGRIDLADKESLEAKILKEYLPEQLTGIELNKVVDDMIDKCSAKTMREMGKVMNELKENFSGRCDFQVASKLVREKLMKN